jgi:hypothetical protein
MAAITITKSAVKPLEGAVIRRGTAGASGSVGDLVFLASDGKWDPATSAAAASAAARGVVVAVNGQAGASTFVDGDRIDIVRYGAVAWGTGMTPGGAVYATTGADGDQTAPVAGFVFKVGYAEAADILFVDPQSGAATAA